MRSRGEMWLFFALEARLMGLGGFVFDYADVPPPKLKKSIKGCFCDIC